MSPLYTISEGIRRGHASYLVHERVEAKTYLFGLIKKPAHMRLVPFEPGEDWYRAEFPSFKEAEARVDYLMRQHLNSETIVIKRYS